MFALTQSKSIALTTRIVYAKFIQAVDVRFGSLADIAKRPRHVMPE